MVIENPEIIWAAGFFDGEGCISFNKQRRKTCYSFRLDMSLGQITPDPLYVFSSLFGGTVSKQGKVYYQWHLYGDSASNALQLMLPYLKVKKSQAVLAIEWSSIRTTFNSLEERDLEGLKYHKQLKDLKVYGFR